MRDQSENESGIWGARVSMAIVVPDPADGDLDGIVPNKLWMGDLEPYMDENFIRMTLGQFGYHIQSFKWIRNHQTGMMARYCFVEFNDPIVTRQVLERLNNQFIPGTNGTKRFKLNWASRKIDSGQQEYNIFVADLSRDVTSQQLLEYFQRHYRSVRYAKVIEDDEGVSKGYGFVRFTDEDERARSFTELDSAMGLGRKPITIKPALAPKARTPTQTTAMAETSTPPAPSTSVPFMYTAPYYQASWPATGYPPQDYSYYQPYAVYGACPQHSQLPHPTTADMYTEDLQDPNPPLDIEELNNKLFHTEAQLFTELEASRWDYVDSTAFKLS